MSSPSPTAKSRVLAAIAAQPAPTRAELHARQRWLLLLGLLITVAVALHDPVAVARKPLAFWLIEGLLVAGFGGLGLAVLARFATTTFGPGERALRALARFALPWLLLSSVLAHVAAPETLIGPAPGWLVHLHCPVLLWAASGLLVALGISALRFADPRAPRSTALAIGAVCGAWAAFAVALQCPFVDPIHDLAAHVLPVPVTLWMTAHFGERVVQLGPKPRGER